MQCPREVFGPALKSQTGNAHDGGVTVGARFHAFRRPCVATVRTMRSRRQWLVEQIVAGRIKAPATAACRSADDDFCGGDDVGDYCRMLAMMSTTETAAGLMITPEGLTTAACYLSRLFELRGQFERGAG